jgi:hypothetical protein
MRKLPVAERMENPLGRRGVAVHNEYIRQHPDGTKNSWRSFGRQGRSRRATNGAVVRALTLTENIR